MSLIMAALRIFWAFILLLVGARFVALLLGADKTNQIVDWIYRHSDFWVKPFFNILHLSNKAVSSTGGVFEPASLIAFIVYFAIGAILFSLLAAGFTGFYRRAPRPW